MIKKIIMFSITFLILVSLSSCSDSMPYKAKQIKVGMTIDEVVEIMGETTDLQLSTPEPYVNSLFWYDLDVKDLASAKKLVSEGEKVYYVGVAFSKNLVIGIIYGYVDQDTTYERMNLYA